MTTPTATTPRGFNEVPPHLEAKNFLQHIVKYAASKRARNTHATSKSRYKFRKLCQNVKTWQADPDAHLIDMKTAWNEWNIDGIKEIRDQPGKYLFMRAILTDDEESEESEDTRVSHQSDGIIVTDTPIITETVIRPSQVTPVPNPFFTLDQKTPTRTWAQRTKTTPGWSQHLQQSSANSLALTDSQSVNLLDAASIEPETITSLSTQMAQLRTLIAELTTWRDQTAPLLDETSKDATMARIALTRTDLHQMEDQIHQIRSISLETEVYDKNRMLVEKDIQETKEDNRRLLKRIEDLESKEWIPHDEYRAATNGLHADIEVLDNTIKQHYAEQSTKIERSHQVNPDVTVSTKVLNDKHEAMTEALNSLYESIRDDLLTETKETLLAELDYELKQDQTIQARIETTKVYARTQLENHIGRLLEPTARLQNPYNPIDRALKSITTEIEDTVKQAIATIDDITRGTIDQAIEDIRLSARSQGHPNDRANPPVPTAPPKRTAPHAPNPMAVTPERTFRGRTVRIDDPPPPAYMAKQPAHRDRARDSREHYDRHDDQDHDRRGRQNHDDYDRSREDYRKQRDQENFLKGHVEASLDSLTENDMLVWYKSFESYCSLHNIPLLTYHQVTKGIDLYPSDQPTPDRPRFSKIIGLKLNQPHLIKDSTAKSIKNARVGRDDGYGALYALLAATTPRLQVNKIAPQTGSNKPPGWDPVTLNLYGYESKIQDYVEYQATKGRHYTDREETLFYLEGLSTDESQRFRTALRTILDKMEQTAETHALPMDYRLGQVAQTVAELAQSDKEVGQDALTILGDPTVRMMHDKQEPIIRYSRDGKPDDRRYDARDNHRGG
jgi:hypothetical protein